MNLRGFFAKVCSLNLFHKKDQNKVGLGISFIENAEMRYAWGSNLLKRSKKYILGDLFHGKRPKNVRLGIYIKEKAIKVRL